jgi:hypothetical protein
MRTLSLRLPIATVLAVVALGVAAAGGQASSGLDACNLVPRQSDGPEQLGTILESVSVAAHDDIWAVGSNVVGGGSSPFAERWDGTAWKPELLDVPQGHTSISSLYDVKAFSADNVWAVGSHRGADPLIQHWDGVSWKRVTPPTIAGTERILTAVDGTSSGDLWVVGQQRVNGQMRGIVLHRTSGGWQMVAPPSDTAVLHDVVMLSSGVPLVAGWSIDPQGFAQALLAVRDGDVWTRERVPDAPERNVFVLGLAVASPGAVWAVGFSNDSPDGNTPVTLRRGADSWTPVAVPDQGGSARLSSVATDRAGTVAVGQVSAGGVTHALAIRVADGAWTPIPGAGDQPPDSLAGVALDDADVWAVGRYITAGGTYGIPTARVYSCG